MLCIRSLKNERDHRASCVCSKEVIDLRPRSDGESEYKGLLTPYAFKFIQKQVEYSANTIILGTEDDRSARVKTNSLGDIVASIDSCKCSFFTSMLLPCRHIFAVRRHFNLTIYDEALCARRWTLAYFKTKQRIYHRPEATEPDTGNSNSVMLNIQSSEPQQKTILSEQQKYQKAYSLLVKIGQIISEQGMMEFNHNMNVLESLKNHMELRKKVVIGECMETAGKWVILGSKVCLQSRQSCSICSQSKLQNFLQY